MERKIIHVIGTGTIGEPLIGLLCDYQEHLGIDEITFHKNSATFNDYKNFIQEKLDDISKIRTPGVESFATIEDTSVGITKVQINEKWKKITML